MLKASQRLQPVHYAPLQLSARPTDGDVEATSGSLLLPVWMLRDSRKSRLFVRPSRFRLWPSAPGVLCTLGGRSAIPRGGGRGHGGAPRIDGRDNHLAGSKRLDRIPW